MAFKGGVPKVQADSAKDRGDREAYIKGAPGKIGYPWKDPKVRPDMIVQTQMRLPEDLMLKVRWLCAMEDKTMRRFVQSILEEAVSARLQKYGAPE
jgi:hypothetical protein